MDTAGLVVPISRAITANRRRSRELVSCDLSVIRSGRGIYFISVTPLCLRERRSRSRPCSAPITNPVFFRWLADSHIARSNRYRADPCWSHDPHWSCARTIVYRPPRYGVQCLHAAHFRSARCTYCHISLLAKKIISCPRDHPGLTNSPNGSITFILC